MADSSYLRFPHLAHNLLTFVAENDVWLARIDEAVREGARAWRLTTDRVQVSNPRLNPSGTHVAWNSQRGGAPEAYAVAVDGGPISRLTYWGKTGTVPGGDGVRGWLSDTEALVTGWPEHWTAKRVWAYAVPLDGPARRLPYGPAADLSIGPDGAVLLGPIANREPAYWKRYRGGRGGQIWYSADGAEFERILRDVGNHLAGPMWVSGRVVFLSDHEGTGAIYSALPDGSDLRRHTDLGTYYPRHATTDGERIVYERAGELWLLDSLDADPVRLDVRLGGVRSGRSPFPVSAASGLGHYALSTTGRVIAAEVRGTAHWLPVEHGPARAVLAEPGVRARIPIVLPGTDTVVCVSDSDGEDGIDLVPADGGPARRILSGGLGRVLELAASPDGRTLAVSSDDCRLTVIDVETGIATELDRNDEHFEPADLVFSPDSAYLAWAAPWTWAGDDRSRIRLARLADREIVDVTPRRFHDFSPAFTQDGKYLALLSNRVHDPAYDAHGFDLGFLPGVRPYLIGLAAGTPSPFAAELDGRPAKAGETKGGDDVAPVVIDFAGIEERIEPFPVNAGSFRKLRAVEGGMSWLDEPHTGVLGEHHALPEDGEKPKPDLVRFEFRKRTLSTLVESVDSYAVSADGKRIAVRKKGELTVRPVKGEDEPITVDLDRIRVTVEPVAEWHQMYDENWRLMRDNFWRADMGGVDWAAIGARYRPLVGRLGSASDLRDLLWEVGGELGTSHAYVNPPAGKVDPALALGWLGADLERDEEGLWRITRILPGENSVAEGRSPLTAMGVAARPGDAIVAVDGRAVDPVRGPGTLLVGKAGKPVELTLRRDGEPDRRVAVTAAHHERTLRYQTEVRARRARVHGLSGGRLGYVHVPDMMSPGWAEYHRDLPVELAREGLVFDLRANSGGHTSQLVVEKLTRKIIGWDAGRRGRPLSYPAEAPRGAIVALADELAGSDGDIATHAFKRYGLGPVVGTRTWGGVVGIDGRYVLVDGTRTTQPKYAFWSDDEGWALENRGVEPDVEVPIAPQDWAAGRDPQLETAVRLALDALARTPAATPPPPPPLRPETFSTQITEHE
ncbi:PDZ domain-containing protein [Actinospica sp. MGRD01-02]|uniref:Tricorn protease homolog n=1 Tax=Actinospica acidithermotolerans TaxID=2828514 RepID=A0A941E9P2_9ACTN|nr:S41 family peptidase [Actinospica acidithermotolerans]MBR7827536.1 PDZ domain-containing protein [Actinospica acidithermotolerans]